MKFLVFSDLQASDGSHERCFKDPTVPLQRWRVETTLELLQKIYKEHQCDGLIDLGDTTDDRQAIPIPTIHSILSRLSYFSGGANVKLVGNHEQWLKSTNVHPGIMYSGVFQVVEKSDVIEFVGCPVVFACVSHIDDIDELQREVSSVLKRAATKNKPVVLLGHMTVNGCTAHGMTIDGGICKASIEKPDLCLLGHIHKHQRVSNNTYYIGSPFQQNYGESTEDKFVAILDTTRLTLKWIETRLPRYYRCTLAEFEKSVLEDSEDRYQVQIKSPEEATRFYAHPLSARAHPLYEYASQAEVVVEGETPVDDGFTLDGLLKDYVAKYSPTSAGLQIQGEDLIQTGLELARS
jgi:hypothetical protein